MYYLIWHVDDDKGKMLFNTIDEAINCSDCLYRDILGVSVVIGKE